MEDNIEHLRLKKDAFIVQGKSRHAIYDLAKMSLYSINNQTKLLIEQLVSTKYPLKNLDAETLEFANDCINNGLLTESKVPTKLSNINELRREYPVQFSWIEVTRQCNMSCPFCYEESSPSCTERMTVSDFELVARQLQKIGVKDIQFIGGEPTILKNDLKKMITFARPRFDFIEVYSNGLLIDKNWCEFFKENNIHLALSLHSYIASEHDQFVEYKGSHSKVVRAIELLNEYGIKYRLGTVKSQRCNIGSPSNETPFRIDRTDNPRITGRADISQYNLEMFRTKAITKDSKRRPLNKPMVVQSVSGHNCFMKDLYISTDLTVYPCVMERRLNYGKLSEVPIEKMLSNNFRNLTKDSIEGCKDCEYRYACFDCRPDSNGRGLYQKPWYCTYNPQTGLWSDIEEYFNFLNKDKLSKIAIVQENR